MPSDAINQAREFKGAPPQEADLVGLVMDRVEGFEKTLGMDTREMFLKWFKQYRGFREFADVWTKAGPRDKDAILYDAKKNWGAHLHIPLSFRTIETLVPKAIANRPKLLYLPRDERWESNVASVQMLIDAQQEQIDIELAFQEIMRNGLIYGIGFGKCFWRKEYASRRRAERRKFLPGYRVGDLKMELVFDDPDLEACDPFDMAWDVYGNSPRTCRWMAHRVWLSLEECLDRVSSGAWNTESAKLLDVDRIRKLNSQGRKWDEIWQDRLQASGLGTLNTTGGESGQIHEVWEFHDGESVLTVLDRTVLVQDAENPCVGHLPFQVYRPTPVHKQMIGIGALEPLEHLQRELDTLRSQRRDAATIALLAGYIFDEGAMDEDDIVFGPGALIPVRNASPNEVIMPAPIREVPSSGYEEEQIIKADFDSVSGISDALNPSMGPPAETATGAQLSQVALAARIELTSRRFEVEVVRNVARCWLYLNQRMILEQRPPLRQMDSGMDYAEAVKQGRWQWFPIGPGELRGEYEIVPEGGSMAQRNIPQDRQDAQMYFQLSQNPHLNGQMLMLKGLRLMGEKNPESFLAQQQPPIPPKAFDFLQAAGIDPAILQWSIQNAQRMDPRFPDEGPNVQQVDQAMGAPA